MPERFGREDLCAQSKALIGGEDRARRFVRDLEALYGGLDTPDLLRAVIGEAFPGRIAVVSSFGTEAAVLLALVAEADPGVPVIFLDTDQHFQATLDYREELTERLGLTAVRMVAPDPQELAEEDSEGELWGENPDRCCGLRKVRPLARALDGFDAWITGRKRYQGGARDRLPHFEAADGRVKVNPLADWSQAEIAAAFAARNLPAHPLVELGYFSVGCAPCTRRASCPSAPRSGRWAGFAKTECGIHRPSA